MPTDENAGKCWDFNQNGTKGEMNLELNVRESVHPRVSSVFLSPASRPGEG